ncbi:MAG: hypothetical protein KF774_10740 [Planctomyces sp.]|nr:hypothetical protein [Planctomyces sp.]
MQHPFEGILPAETGTREATDAPATRRSFFGRIAGGLAGLAALMIGRSSLANGRATTQALGEEGGRPGPAPQPRNPQMTTFALGEEGSSPRPPRNTATTYALGEEGSSPRPPRNTVTTFALGEEGSAPPRQITTFALGEEGAASRPSQRWPVVSQPQYTTRALGEEGGCRGW